MTKPSAPSRQFSQTLDLDAPREAVWKALTQGDEIARWFAPTATVEPKVGGAVHWGWKDHFDWPLTIEVFEPDQHLRTRYDVKVEGGEQGETVTMQPLFIDFFLEGRAGGTTLRVVHSGFGAEASFDDEFAGISHGWPIELESLRLYVERHLGRKRHLTWAQATLDLPADAVWRRLAAADGLACGEEVVQLKAGETVDFATADGDQFVGEIIATYPHEFVARATSHGNGFLRVWSGSVGGRTLLWLWLATYADAPPAGLQQRWDELVHRLFSAHKVEQAAS